MVNWEEKRGGIDWSITVIHAQNITHLLKLTIDCKERRNAMSLPVIHAHTKHN